MSAANDGADADSRIAAVARRLIFITVPMGSTGHWYFVRSFGPQLYTACGRLQSPTSLSPDFPCPALRGKSDPGWAPRNLAMVIAVMAFRSAAR